MSNEPNKPITAEELKEKELECVVGGLKVREAGIVVPFKLVDGAQFVPAAGRGGALC